MAEGTGAVVAVVAKVAMTLADNSGNDKGRQWRQQAETEAVVGADNNQPESGGNSGSRNGDHGGNRDGGSGGSSNSSDGGADSG